MRYVGEGSKFRFTKWTQKDGQTVRAEDVQLGDGAWFATDGIDFSFEVSAKLTDKNIGTEVKKRRSRANVAVHGSKV